jgi:hypothetical protein
MADFGDERLKKDAGLSVRGSRDNADKSRTSQDGGSLSAEERRKLLRNEWVQEVLPKPPTLPGFHACWLSTNNSTDPIYKRIQRGYLPVKASEVPGFGSQYSVSGGEFDGCIGCNEMLLFKIPIDMYNDLMTIYHHDLPSEQEQSIHERVSQGQTYDSSGRPLQHVEGGFAQMGRAVKPPMFS